MSNTLALSGFNNVSAIYSNPYLNRLFAFLPCLRTLSGFMLSLIKTPTTYAHANVVFYGLMDKSDAIFV